MCRMLAIMSSNPIDANLLLSFQQLAKKGKVAKGRRQGHADGWGIVTYNDGAPMYLGRQPTNAYSDPLFKGTCSAIRKNRVSGIVFFQLRKRSKGRKNIYNTPPLAMGNFCFMHNGTVHGLGNEGESDSVQLLQIIFNEISKYPTILEALRGVYHNVSRNYKYTSLTSILSNGRSVYAVKYVRSGEDEDYYDLMYAKKDGQTIVSQEKTWPLNWQRIENKRVMIVHPDLETNILKM